MLRSSHFNHAVNLFQSFDFSKSLHHLFDLRIVEYYIILNLIKIKYKGAKLLSRRYLFICQTSEDTYNIVEKRNRGLAEKLLYSIYGFESAYSFMESDFLFCVQLLDRCRYDGRGKDGCRRRSRDRLQVLLR